MRIAIEGLIGIGKSTILEILRDQRDLSIRLEPIESWTLLSQFYASPHQEAFPFELQVLCSYCHDSFDSQAIMERSPDVALHVFVKMLHDDGILSHGEHRLLKEAATSMQSIKWADAFIYLQAPVDVCLQRIAWRNRGSEARSVTKDYLVKLHEAQDRFFSETTKPVLYVDLKGDESPEYVAAKVAECVRLLRVQS